LRAVFEGAAKSFGWPQKKTQFGQGFGLGLPFSFHYATSTQKDSPVVPRSGLWHTQVNALTS